MNVYNLLFFKHFDCNFLASKTMGTNHDLSKRSFAKISSEHIISNDLPFLCILRSLIFCVWVSLSIGSCLCLFILLLNLFEIYHGNPSLFPWRLRCVRNIGRLLLNFLSRIFVCRLFNCWYLSCWRIFISLSLLVRVASTLTCLHHIHLNPWLWRSRHINCMLNVALCLGMNDIVYLYAILKKTALTVGDLFTSKRIYQLLRIIISLINFYLLIVNVHFWILVLNFYWAFMLFCWIIWHFKNLWYMNNKN